MPSSSNPAFRNGRARPSLLAGHLEAPQQLSALRVDDAHRVGQPCCRPQAIRLQVELSEVRASASSPHRATRSLAPGLPGQL